MLGHQFNLQLLYIPSTLKAVGTAIANYFLALLE